MAGHSKWANIKHKKGAADAKRGKAFSRVSKEITTAVRQGLPDPDANPRLRAAIASAKAINMPKDGIERAVKKGTGELGGGILEELMYEAYGPGGVAIVIDILTDNRNRTASNIRLIFTKAGLSLADPGSVSRMFSRKARFALEGENIDEESLYELLLEADVDVEEIEVGEGTAEIIAPPEAFNDILATLENTDMTIQESEVTKIANPLIDVDAATAQKVMKIVDKLEDDDDVSKVYTSMHLTDEVIGELSKLD
jgi:YebC/PmpR family DNA-binding regulatory protein